MCKKLILIGPTESELTKRGNRFPNIAAFFAKEGYQIKYYTSNFYHAEKRFFSKKEINQVKRDLIYELNVLSVLGYYSNISPKRVISNFIFSIKLFFVLITKVAKGDKVILPSRPVELIFFMSLLKRLKGVEIYLDIQDIWPDALKINSKIKTQIFNFYCNSYLKPSLKFYDATFHVAPSFKQWLRRYAKKTPSSFVPLGWENKRWSQIQYKEVTKDRKVIKMVVVAQLQHQIDVTPILNILKNNNNLHLSILGEDGTGERYNDTIKFIKAHNLKNIDIIGKIDRSEMINYLEDKDIGVLPMITSSIPNKIFDYMAAMLPTIVLGDNDSSEFVVKNDIGWQCNYDSKSLELLINKLSLDDISIKKKNVLETRTNFSRDILHKKIKSNVLYIFMACL